MKWLLRLYPRAWRERYGEEFQALLEQCPKTPGTLLDVLIGAADAHLHPLNRSGGLHAMENRPRNSVLIVFCAYAAFVVAGLGLYGMVDDSPFVPAMAAHLEFKAVWFLIEGGSAIALAAIALGGLPIGLSVLQRILATRRRDLILLLAIPILVVLAWTAYAAFAAAVIAGLLSFPLPTRALVAGEPIPTGNQLLGTVGVSLLVAGSIAAVAAVCALVVRAGVAEVTLRLPRMAFSARPFDFARLPATGATLAMAFMLASTLAWGTIAGFEAPRAFAENLIPWLEIVGVMAASTAVAAVTLFRWHRSLRQA